MSQEHTVNILVLAASNLDSDTTTEEVPVFLTHYRGASILEIIAENCANVNNSNVTFSFLERHIRKFFLDDIVSQISPHAKTVVAPEQTEGSACTALLAACQLDQDAELLLVSANELIHQDFQGIIESFRERDLAAGTLVFNSLDPVYSYVALSDDGLVTETAQRRPISRHATTGLFWYKKTSDFVGGAMSMIRKDARTNGNFFIAPVFNELILANKKIGTAHIEKSDYTPLKTTLQVNANSGIS